MIWHTKNIIARYASIFLSSALVIKIVVIIGIKGSHLSNVKYAKGSKEWRLRYAATKKARLTNKNALSLFRLSDFLIPYASRIPQIMVASSGMKLKYNP